MRTPLSAITVVMSIQVIMRYLVGQALPWPEELSRYCYIWITFLSIGLTIRTGSYFRVTALLIYFLKNYIRLWKYSATL